MQSFITIYSVNRGTTTEKPVIYINRILLPYTYYAFIKGEKLTSVITDHDWLNSDFIKTVQQRGKAIIQARGKSSAASAAWAAIDHAADWHRPTAPGEWVSMAVTSDGSYGIPEGLIYSFPCTVDEQGEYTIAPDVVLSASARERAMKSAEELVAERDSVSDILG